MPFCAGGLREIVMPEIFSCGIEQTMTLWGALDEHTAYLLRCCGDSGSDSSDGGRGAAEWWVLKRFSDFDDLRLFLASSQAASGGAAAEVSPGVAFPSKVYVGSLAEAVVLERRLALERWLLAVLGGPFGESKAVKMFLRDDGSGSPMHLRSLRDDFLAPGTCVEVVGLTGAAQHNGRRGVVKGYNSTKARYEVELEEDEEAVEGGARPKLLGIRHGNLIRGGTAEPEPEAEAVAGEGAVPMVWRIGRVSRLLKQLAQQGGRGCVGSQAVQLGGERWSIRLAMTSGGPCAGEQMTHHGLGVYVKYLGLFLRYSALSMAACATAFSEWRGGGAGTTYLWMLHLGCCRWQG
eukprot:SAG11_NODE_111_length_16190_cov_9.912808_4_plen_349_part_00